MKIFQKSFMKDEYFGNTVEDYLIALGIFLLVVISLAVFQRFMLSRFKRWAGKTVNRLDDMVVDILSHHLMPLFYLAALYLGANQLTLNATASYVLKAVVVIGATIQITRLVVLMMLKVVEKQTKGGTVVRNISSMLRIVCWGVGVVFVLDNLGFDVNAVIAGLGIGGVAVAFAAQAILGDLFNYFVIFLDRPFAVGDFVIIDDYMGVVDHIGVKTTRIKSLGGEQLIFSNTDLTSSRVRNYKRMQSRRVVFRFGVVYQTKHAQLKQIPNLVKQAVEKIKDAKLDRAHFFNFGDSSLDFEVVYYLQGSDYNRYMDVQQALNLDLVECFAKEGIDFAYPTRTLYVQNS